MKFFQEVDPSFQEVGQSYNKLQRSFQEADLSYEGVKQFLKNVKLPPQNVWMKVLGYQLGISDRMIDEIKSGVDIIADVLRSGIDMTGKTMDIMDFWCSFTKLSADIWKHALNVILDEARNIVIPETEIHMLSAPPLVITPSPDLMLIKEPIRKFVENFQIVTEVQPYYLPGTRIHIPGVYTYGRQDLYPYYKIIRDSILDPGDVNAPRFDSSRSIGVLTVIAQLGAPITAILDLARIRYMLPQLFLPEIPAYLGAVKISAVMTEQGACVTVDPDLLIRVLSMMPIGKEGKDNPYATVTYKLLRTTSSNPKKKVVCKIGTFGELILKNFTILDEEAKWFTDENIYYTLEIEHERAKIISRRVALFGGATEAEVQSSIPPDWKKLSVLSAISPPGLIKDVILAIEGVVNYTSALVCTATDIMSDMIKQFKNVLNVVKDYISLAQYLLDTIYTAIKNLAEVRLFINYSIIRGDTASLIDYYHSILVDNPPNLKIDREDNLIYLCTAVAAAMDPIKVLGSIISNIESAKQTQVELYKDSVDATEKNIKEFYEWLEQTQITLEGLKERLSTEWEQFEKRLSTEWEQFKKRFSRE